MSATASSSEQELARELRLRAPHAPVTRLSRKVLVGLGATASIAIVGAVAWAMAEKPHAKASAELYQTRGQRPPEAMAALPADYASSRGDVPKLGPPLPGDLGRPMLAAGQAGSSPMPTSGAASGGAPSAPQPSPEQQALVQERDSARTSHLFASDATPQSAGPLAVVSGSTDPAVAALERTNEEGAPSAAAGGSSAAVLAQSTDHQTVSAERLQSAPSPYVIQAGTVIPAALITGLRSDLPGQVIAQVTQNLYDSLTGRILLAPQGSKLIGTYDSQVAFGQDRVLLAWTRLILPNGKSIVLDRQPGADAQGFAGVQDGVDHHWKTLFGAALLSTVLSVGTQAGASETDSAILQALRQGAANSLNQAGQQVVSKALGVQPTLTIRPGYPVRVMVTRDLVLEPYKE